MPDYNDMEHLFSDGAELAQREMYNRRDYNRRDCRAEYERGYREGYRQGYRQGRRDCFFPGIPRR